MGVVAAMDPDDIKKELVQLHRSAFGWAMACCGRNRDLAAEVLQQAYCRILAGDASFAGRSQFSTWVLGTIRLVALERHRNQQRQRARRHLDGPFAAEVHAAVPSNHTTIEQQELSQQLSAEETVRSAAGSAALDFLSRPDDRAGGAHPEYHSWISAATLPTWKSVVATHSFQTTGVGAVNEDKELKQLFQALRKVDEELAPSFSELEARLDQGREDSQRASDRKPSLRPIPLALSAIAASVAIGLAIWINTKPLDEPDLSTATSADLARLNQVCDSVLTRLENLGPEAMVQAGLTGEEMAWSTETDALVPFETLSFHRRTSP